MKTNLTHIIYLIILFCLFSFVENIDAQEITKDNVYEKVDVMPAYPGGVKALINTVASNVKYPEEAKKDGIEGKVLVQFYVDKDGKIIDSKVIQGIGHGCDEEALRVIKLLKPFSPGLEKGKPVIVRLVLPIAFKLADKK
jgi:protein TonB